MTSLVLAQRPPSSPSAFLLIFVQTCSALLLAQPPQSPSEQHLLAQPPLLAQLAGTEVFSQFDDVFSAQRTVARPAS